MRVIQDQNLATYTLIPMEPEEEKTLASIAEVLKPGENLSYGGRESEYPDDKFCVVHLHAGSQRQKQRTTEGKVTLIQDIHVGGVELVLRGSTEKDKYEVNAIRNTCYFGTGSLIFLGALEIGGKKSIVVTGAYCKLCGGAMIDAYACEWKMCDACSAKCNHEYKRGPIHGGVIDIGMGDFCRICGRSRPLTPQEKDKAQLQHHLDAERELGISIIYKNIPLTPRQIDYLQRNASPAS